MRAKHTPLRQAFTLIEVLVFTAILSLVFVTTLAIATQALRISKNAERRTIATHYAGQLSEWLLAESEADWDSFVANRTSSAATIFCFNASPITSWPTVGDCTTPGLGTVFKRTATLTRTPVANGQYQVEVFVVVTWNEGPNTFTVPVTLLLTRTI